MPYMWIPKEAKILHSPPKRSYEIRVFAAGPMLISAAHVVTT